MLRPWIKLVVFLSAALAVLVWLNTAFDSKRSSKRAEASTFVSCNPRGLTPENIASLEILLPGSSSPWKYVRSESGWRIPGYRNAFALTDEVEGLIKTVLTGRGLPVGTAAADDAHFGLLSHQVLTVRLRDQQQAAVLELAAGDTPPGQQQDECFVLVNDRPTVYQFTDNVWRGLGPPLAHGLPPLTDTQVFAKALKVGTPRKIRFSGERAPSVLEITRSDLPPDPQAMDPRQGGEMKPTVEWHGTFADGRRDLLDDAKVGPYVHRIISLTYNELLGELTPRDAERLDLAHPLWSITLEQDAGEVHTLTLSRAQAGSNRTVVNITTNQLFAISGDTAESLLEDPAAAVAPEPPLDR